MMPRGPASNFLAEKLLRRVPHDIRMNDHAQHRGNKAEHGDQHVSPPDAPDYANISAAGTLDKSNVGHEKFRHTKSIRHLRLGIQHSHSESPSARGNDQPSTYVRFVTEQFYEQNTTSPPIAAVSRASICNQRDCNRVGVA